MIDKVNKCKVSVIVSIYNSEEYMRDSLDSALNQTLDDIELICVYKSSLDRTEDILREYARRDSRVKLYEQKDTTGCGPAKNLGIHEATGEFITFLDADDYYSTNKCLEKLYYSAQKHNVKICGGFRSFHFQDGSVVGHPLHREVCKGRSEGLLLQYIDYQFDYHFHSFLYDRKMVVENGFCFNSTLTYDDPHFFVRAMLCAEEFYVIPVEMYCYRLGEPYQWGRIQTRDSLISFIDILRLSRDQNLAILHWKTVSRINNGEYYTNFVKHLNEENVELLQLMLEANKLVSKDLINQVQQNLPPRGVLDTQDVCMDKIECSLDGEYVLKPLRHILGPDRQLSASDTENNEPPAMLESTRFERELSEELNGVRQSVSYKVGRFVTWMPRKCRGAMRCYKDHGSRYTVELISCKLRTKLKPKHKIVKKVYNQSNGSLENKNINANMNSLLGGEEDNIKVSIIVPVFNVSKYLRECLDSIVNQTLKEIEIICGDGGSNDGSLEILQEYASRDSRIKIISKDGSGYGQSVNECMDIARGKYIGIVESDDVVTLNAYETLYSVAESMKVDWIRADIYYYYAMNEEGKQLQKESIIYDGDFYNIVLNPQTDYRPYKSGMRTWSGIYNREFLNRHGIRHNETPGGSYQDVGFYLKNLYYATRVCFTDNAFYMWRQDNPGSSIHYNSKKLVEKSFNEWRLNKEYLDYNPQLSARAVASYHYRKFFSYLWTIEMADEADRPDVLKAAVKEFREAEWQNELDCGFFESWEWDKLQEMMNCPEQFYTKYYSGKVKERTSLKRIIKAGLKPLANFVRRIVYKCMRDVIFQIERKVDDTVSWNRGQMEEVLELKVGKLDSTLQTIMVQEYSRMQEIISGDIMHIQDNLERVEKEMQQQLVQFQNYVETNILKSEQNINSAISQIENSLDKKISATNEKLSELERITAEHQSGDVDRKNKDTVNNLVELLNLSHSYDKREIVRKNLKQIELEVFSYCNRRCWFCPNHKIDRISQNNFMPEEVYLKILTELKEINYSNTITFSRYNEPLADRIIIKRVEQAREYCPRAFIRTNTNGDYLTRGLLDELAAAGMNEMEIQCYFNENEELSLGVYEERLKTITKKLGIDGYNILQCNEADRIKAVLNYKDMYLTFFSLNMKRLANNRGETLENVNKYSRTENCLIPLKHLYVDYNGSYMLCCNVRSDVEEHKNFILGDAIQDSIFDIFNSDKMISFRKNLGTYGNKIPPCSTCSFVIMDDDIKLC